MVNVSLDFRDPTACQGGKNCTLFYAKNSLISSSSSVSFYLIQEGPLNGFLYFWSINTVFIYAPCVHHSLVNYIKVPLLASCFRLISFSPVAAKWPVERDEPYG